MNTGNRNVYGRTIWRGPRGGEYTINPTTGRQVRKFRRAAAPAAPAGSPPPVKAVAKMMRIDNKYLSRTGYVKTRKGKFNWSLNAYNVNNLKRIAFSRDPKYLYKPAIPFINTENASAFLPKLKLKNGQTHVASGLLSHWLSKAFFNKNGEVYFVTLNGRKIPVTSSNAKTYFQVTNPRILRTLKRTIAQRALNYPLHAIPPNSPAAIRERRTSPNLLANMLNRIYVGGRGENINASNYTNEERNVLARRLNATIYHFKHQRNAKKNDATRFRLAMRNSTISNRNREALKNAINRANERVGYYDDAVRAYTRGLRAVKPLTGNVTPRVRAMSATPNRATPAPANVNMNTIYMPLEKPHLVVKTPGAGGTIYLNPETFVGFIKNAARVNIPVANVRHWLRKARRNFPNEPLFRHPVNRSKNVTANHIRFSR